MNVIHWTRIYCESFEDGWTFEMEVHFDKLAAEVISTGEVSWSNSGRMNDKD
jgi:hypothetical protein